MRATGWSPLYMADHISVGVTLVVRLHRFGGVNRGREAGKNPRVRKARREIRIGRWRRGDVGGRECLSKTFS